MCTTGGKLMGGGCKQQLQTQEAGHLTVIELSPNPGKCGRTPPKSHTLVNTHYKVRSPTYLRILSDLWEFTTHTHARTHAHTHARTHPSRLQRSEFQTRDWQGYRHEHGTPLPTSIPEKHGVIALHTLHVVTLKLPAVLETAGRKTSDIQLEVWLMSQSEQRSAGTRR